jgi:hypothetical protein
MEQYSTDVRGRGQVYVTIALIVVGLTYGFHQLVDLLPFRIPWWVDAPSFAVFFGVANVVFDRYLWRARLLGLRLCSIPYFGGDWTGVIRARDAEGRSVDIPVHVRIAQTWSAIGIKGTTANGVTRSKIAGIRVEDDELRYEYETHAHVMESDGRHHVGFAVVQLVNSNGLEGYYYTLEGSTTKGLLTLQRSEPDHRSGDRGERVHAAVGDQ